MHITELDYSLPTNLIAQKPALQRDNCRLLIYNRNNNIISHKYFYDIFDFIYPDDVLIFNDTKVFPARFFGVKEITNAKIEFLLLRRLSEKKWETLIKPAKRVKLDTQIRILDKDKNKTDIIININAQKTGGIFIIDFNKVLGFEDFFDFGYIPLPPYIKRVADDKFDKKYYQTVYAQKYGAVAAPTAGFHFTKNLIDKLKDKGAKIGFITLHIGWDTFAPIKEEIIEKHKMHKEFVYIPNETVDIINNRKGRCIAVGTTVVRTLESAAIGNGKIKSLNEFVDIFIKPDYKIKVVDALVTNFHLPKSTLLLLVSAFTGLDKLKQIYQEAINMEYRFYSYGDAMLII